MPSHQKKDLLLGAFVMNTNSHILHGAWKTPGAANHEFNDLAHWVDLAKTLETGGFDYVFFADVMGLRPPFGGTHDLYLHDGLQFPSNDPLVILSALAAVTETLGLVFTSGVVQDPPYDFARRISTLDHASKGRLGWNIITSVSAAAWRNLGWTEDDFRDHDGRYRIAAEYVDVLYKLWVGSWDDDAFIADPQRGIVTDPEKVHLIDHVSEHFRVEGPHFVSPSPQRVPVLFQAGSSRAGQEFSARNAEVQFITSPDPVNAKRQIDAHQQLIGAAGRAAGAVQYVQGLSFVVGSTEEEAKRKARELNDSLSIEGLVAHAGGDIGIDLGALPTSTPLSELADAPGVESLLRWAAEASGSNSPTIADLGRVYALNTQVVGTPSQIASRLAEWQEAGVDGINVINATIPGSYVEFIEHVIPELEARGLHRGARPPAEARTLRGIVSGTDRPAAEHPSSAYRGAFTGGLRREPVAATA